MCFSVVCFCFRVSGFTLCLFHVILVQFGLLSGHLLEKAAHSVDHMFSIVISRFGFEGGILVLIAPVPGHCILVTLNKYMEGLGSVTIKQCSLS